MPPTHSEAKGIGGYKTINLFETCMRKCFMPRIENMHGKIEVTNVGSMSCICAESDRCGMNVLGVAKFAWLGKENMHDDIGIKHVGSMSCTCVESNRFG